MLTYLIPTRNRPEPLAETLAALAALPSDAHDPLGGSEIVVVDDASRTPIDVPAHAGGLPVRLVRRDVPAGAAARNDGARAAAGTWLAMLDDDSHPLDAGHVAVIAAAPPDVAAIGAEIRLPCGRREDGGLPEVIVGCGAAVRRDAFLGAGGYDPSFDYYVEEYDLCARFLRGGRRVVHDRRFRVLHRKVMAQRDMNRILRRLVRNGGWVAQRCAPEAQRAAAVREVVDRCAAIARREDAVAGFERGLDELLTTIDAQPRRPLTGRDWDRFTGRAAAERALRTALDPGVRAAIVDPGKHASIVRDVLVGAGAEVVPDERDAEFLVVGTLSPGPMLDAFERRQAGSRPVLAPWSSSTWSRAVRIPATAGV